MAAGAVEGVDFIYGCHLWSQLETGKVTAMPGPFMAAADFFKLAITGRGGHGGMPQDAIDTIAIASQVVANLQHIVARRIDPLESAVVTIGSFHAGDAPNVIPGRAELQGTVRSFDPAIRERLPGLVEDVIRGVTSAHGADYELDYNFGYRPVVNDEARDGAGARADRRAASSRSSPRSWAATTSPPTSKTCPGCYAFIGAAPEGEAFPHHHPRFAIDERALATGVRLHVDVATAALRG